MKSPILLAWMAASGTLVMGAQPPAAHFSMSAQGRSVNDGQGLTLTAPVNGTATVNFTSTSTQGSAAIAAYAWKNNGSTICSNSPACSLPFGSASSTITLTVTDVAGQGSTATAQVNVNFQRGPTAHLSMTGQGKFGTDGQTLALKAPVNGTATVSLGSTSAQGSAMITSYVWKRNESAICSNSPSCSFTLGTANNTISLTVTDANGQSSTATSQVNVTFQ